MTGKRVLYLGYWGVNDVLTASSIFPSLRRLSMMPVVDLIHFCTIERNPMSEALPPLPTKTRHIPLKSLRWGGVLLRKAFDFIWFPFRLSRIIRRNSVDVVICRSSLAGGMVLSITRRLRIPLIVESFEPHADYMVESGVWSGDDLRTRTSRQMEERLKKEASFLLPVSDNYLNQLKEEGVEPQRVRLMPCTVDIGRFSLNELARKTNRDAWGWTDFVVGIYVGKFGGIYHEEEAFTQFAAAFRHFGKNFGLIVLSGQENVAALFSKHGGKDIDMARVRVMAVAHEQVPGFLSTADFAFSMVKPARSRKFCSPIKHGEYWANGLPVIMEDGVGDDSDIVRREGGGFVLTPGNEPSRYQPAFEYIASLIRNGRSATYPAIRELAIRHRDEVIVGSVYHELLH